MHKLHSIELGKPNSMSTTMLATAKYKTFCESSHKAASIARTT